MTLDICHEVRLNDNRGGRENHLVIGDGTIDFEHLFDRLDRLGYDRPYTVALGAKEDSLRGVGELVETRRDGTN